MLLLSRVRWWMGVVFKMRKAFNFYRSYFDVFKELADKDKLAFITALLERQFEGKEPKLKGMANFAYLSQKHNIDAQVAGFEDKTGIKLTPIKGGIEGGVVGASAQEEGKGKEKDKGEKTLIFLSDEFRSIWKIWITYKAAEHNDKYKTIDSEQQGINKLVKLSGGDPVKALMIVNESIGDRYKGLFPLKKDANTTPQIITGDYTPPMVR